MTIQFGYTGLTVFVSRHILYNAIKCTSFASFRTMRFVPQHILSVHLIALLIFIFLLSGCDRKTNIEPPCPPLPVVDGYVTIKTRGGITLRLPGDARLIRGSNKIEKGGCQILKEFYSDWLWYQGKLIPEHDYAIEVAEKRVYIMLYGYSEGLVSDRFKEPWRYQPVLPHKFYPLDYYPHSHWSTSEGPKHPDENIGYWGIRGRNSLLTNEPTLTLCSMEKTNISDSIAERKASGFNLFACRGGMAIPRKEKYIAFSIDVAAEGVPEIDHIYDAIEQKFQNFVEE